RVSRPYATPFRSANLFRRGRAQRLETDLLFELIPPDIGQGLLAQLIPQFPHAGRLADEGVDRQPAEPLIALSLPLAERNQIRVAVGEVDPQRPHDGPRRVIEPGANLERLALVVLLLLRPEQPPRGQGDIVARPGKGDDLAADDRPAARRVLCVADTR